MKKIWERNDGIFLTGFVAMVGAIAWIWPPVGLLFFGLCLVGAAIVTAMDKEKAEQTGDTKRKAKKALKVAEGDADDR